MRAIACFTYHWARDFFIFTWINYLFQSQKPFSHKLSSLFSSSSTQQFFSEDWTRTRPALTITKKIILLAFSWFSRSRAVRSSHIILNLVCILANFYSWFAWSWCLPITFLYLPESSPACDLPCLCCSFKPQSSLRFHFLPSFPTLVEPIWTPQSLFKPACSSVQYGFSNFDRRTGATGKHCYKQKLPPKFGGSYIATAFLGTWLSVLGIVCTKPGITVVIDTYPSK